MIQHLQQIFRSITKSLDILYVIEGVKPCARILIFEEDANNIAGFLNQNKLSNTMSDFKVLKQASQSEFYSDKSIKISKDSAEKGYFIFYVSKNKEVAEKAKAAEARNNHIELGLLLGYPKCCCEFFGKSFNDKNTDLTLKILENSDGYEFSFYANIAARHFDVNLLSHFPHSFGCIPSIEIAKKNLKIINRHSHQLAALFSGILQGAVVYSNNEGIYILRKYEKIGDEIIYSDVLTTVKSKLYYLLSSSKELKIIDKNNFIVNGESIKGKDYGVIVFT